MFLEVTCCPVATTPEVIVSHSPISRSALQLFPNGYWMTRSFMQAGRLQLNLKILESAVNFKRYQILSTTLLSNTITNFIRPPTHQIVPLGPRWTYRATNIDNTNSGSTAHLLLKYNFKFKTGQFHEVGAHASLNTKQVSKRDPFLRCNSFTFVFHLQQ